MKRPKNDLSPKTYKILYYLNIVVSVCCLVIGGIDVYFHEWTGAACMFLIFAFAVYNAYTFKDRIN